MPPAPKPSRLNTFKSFMHIRTGGGLIEYRDDGSGDMSGGGCNACGCYQLTEYNWKEAYGKPGGLAACLPPTIFLLLRLLFFVAWFGTNAYAVYQLVTVYSFPMQYYLTKLTSWSALLLLAYLGFALLSTFMAQCSKMRDGKGSATPCFVSITWLLQTVNCVIQPMVTLMYFALVHEWGAPREDFVTSAANLTATSEDAVKYSFAITVVGHGLNTVLTILDLLISRNRRVLGHFVHALVFAGLYLLFTIVYYLAGGTNEDGISPYIYPALDWRGFGTSTVLDDCSTTTALYCRSLSTRVVATILLLLGVPCMSCLCFITYLIRRQCRQAVEETTGEQKTVVV